MKNIYIYKIESIKTKEYKLDLVITIIDAQNKEKIVSSVRLSEEIFSEVFNRNKDWLEAYKLLSILRKFRGKKLESEQVSHREIFEELSTVQNNCQTQVDDLIETLNQLFNEQNKLKDIVQKLEEIKQTNRNKQKINKNHLVIQIDDVKWLEIPWEKLEVFKNFKISFTSDKSKPKKRINRPNQIRILLVLGDNEGIDTNQDLKVWEELQAQYHYMEILTVDTTRDLYEALWDENGWDLVYFAGHSTTKEDPESGKFGQFSIHYGDDTIKKETDWITIGDLKTALTNATRLGLKLVIFNSCDGIGLAWQLASVHIPQVMVMRRNIPNPVAVKFIEEFLKSYSGGASLLDAVEKATNQIKEMEELTENVNDLETKGFVGASWLPVVYQNLYDAPPTWEELKGKGKTDWMSYCQAWLAIQAGYRLKNNPLTSEAIGYELEEIYIPLGLLEKRKKKKQDNFGNDISPESGSNIYLDRDGKNEPFIYEVTKRYENDEFLKKVIRDGDSKSSGTRILIIGESGAGKTTFSQKLADWIFAGKKDENEEVISEYNNNKEDNKEVVIWIPLADLQGRNLEEYLSNVWLKKAGELGIEEAIINEDESTSQDSNSDTDNENSQELKILKKFFSQHQVWLILDGADEMVSNDNSLINITSQVDLLRKKIQGFKSVITCRLNVWETSKDSIEKDWDTYRNLDFSYGDDGSSDLVGQFIKRWFRFKEEWGVILREELDESGRERIRDLVRNPLRLSLLCAMWHGDKATLPETKAQLYSEYVKRVYQWKGRIFLPDEYQTLDVIKDYLALLIYFQDDSSLFTVIQNELSSQTDISDDLSWFINSQSQQQFSSFIQNSLTYFIEWTYSVYCILAHQQQRLNDLLGELSKEALDLNESHYRLSECLIDKILGESKELVRQLGWLNQIGVDIHNQIAIYENKPIYEPIYAFYHTSFQEYFVATIINEAEFFLKHTLPVTPKSVNKGIYRIFDQKWQEVYLFWLGRDDLDSKKKEKLLQKLTKFESKINSPIDFYAIRGLLLSLMGLEEFQNCSSELVKTIISHINSEFVIPQFRGIVDFIGNEKIRNRDKSKLIIDFLLKIGSNLAVDNLASLLEKNKRDWWVYREDIIIGLGKIRSKKAIDILISMLNNQRSERERQTVVRALGKIKNDESINAIISALDDEDTKVQIAAILALENIQNELAINALISVLRHENNWVLQCLAVNALGNIKSDEAKNEVISAINHENKIVQLTAVQVLENITEDLDVKALITQWKQSNNNWLRNNETNINTMQNLVNYEILSASQDDPRKKDYFRKYNDAHLEQIINNVRVDDLISYALKQEDNSSLDELIFQVFTGNPEFLNTFFDSANSEQSIAIQALGKIGNQKAVNTLITILNNNDKNNIFQQHRYNAAEALGEIRDKKSINALVLALNDEDLLLRETVTEIISQGKILDKKVVDALIFSALNDEREGVRETAITALGNRINKKVIKSLLRTFNDGSTPVKCNTAKTLFNISETISYPEFYQITQKKSLSELLQDIYYWSVFPRLIRFFRFKRSFPPMGRATSPLGLLFRFLYVLTIITMSLTLILALLLLPLLILFYIFYFIILGFKKISKYIKNIDNDTDKSITVDQNLEQTNSTPEINYPISSQSPSNYQQIMQVFVLLYNSGTENEGIHTLQTGNQDTVLIFESEEDATDYALRLEAQSFPQPSVELIDRDEIEKWCASAGYQWRLIREGMLINPSEKNIENLSTLKNQNNKKEKKGVFDIYTDKAINAIMLAQEECRSSKFNYLGTEHLLLGLIAEGTDIAAKILRSKGIKLKTARLKVKEIFGESSNQTPEEIPLTPRCEEVFKLSQQEAKSLGNSEIETGHILLALTRMESGVAIEVLKSFDLDLEELRTEIITLITSEKNVE